MIGAYTPIAILRGGLMASLAAYSYIKLGVYYKDEGATYSFICMSAFAILLTLAGSLQIILEFGNITFLLVSILMAFAHFKIRHLTDSSQFG